MLDIIDYYRDERIVKRILEYCGVSALQTDDFFFDDSYERYNPLQSLAGRHDLEAITDGMSCEYLVGAGPYLIEHRGYDFESVRNFSLGWLLDHGLDLFRSIWDKESTLGILDVEYFSRIHPGQPYSNQVDVYAKLEPFHRCLMFYFFHFGFNPLVLATGQGYHYVFRVSNASPVAAELEEIGFVEPTTAERYFAPQGKRENVVTLAQGLRYDGMGKLVEFLVHLAIQNRDKFGTWLPVTIGDIAVGNDVQEAVNLDLSCYANPLYMRDIRLPFSTHQKHKMHPHKVGIEISEATPVQLAIPRYCPSTGNELSLFELFQNRRHFHNTANYAGAVRTEIPECSQGVKRLLHAYYGSPLASFHRDFDRTEQDQPEAWPMTYDRFDLRQVPPCVAQALMHPNPHLLQPTQLQTVVRTLCSRGWWHPKHVAGLIRSRYERDYGWEIDWDRYDPAMWAAVWTRFYAGMLADETDGKLDFNCASHQDKGIAWAGIPFCVDPHCGYNLLDYR